MSLSNDMREHLFGDVPISKWPSRHSPYEPWTLFRIAREHLEAERKQQAIETLHRIVGMEDLEPRHYLQGWFFLRGLGVEPPAEIAKKLYGVVVEVTLEEGLDIVAAYVNHSARFFNFSGRAIVWEGADNSLDNEIDELLAAGRVVVSRIGRWEGVRPAAPEPGQARITMLTPGGLHFGQAQFDALARDAMGGPVIRAAMVLMKRLIEKASQKKQS